MTNGNLHQIWVEQCAAAEAIKLRYGLKAAFDFAVGAVTVTGWCQLRVASSFLL